MIFVCELISVIFHPAIVFPHTKHKPYDPTFRRRPESAKRHGEPNKPKKHRGCGPIIRGFFISITRSNSKRFLSYTSIPPLVLYRLIIRLHLFGCTRAYTGHKWIPFRREYFQVNMHLQQLIGRYPSKIILNLWCSNGREVPRSSKKKREVSHDNIKMISKWIRNDWKMIFNDRFRVILKLFWYHNHHDLLFCLQQVYLFLVLFGIKPCLKYTIQSHRWVTSSIQKWHEKTRILYEVKISIRE